MEYDPDRAGDLALALLYLTLHDGTRAWKGLDWDVLAHLHANGRFACLRRCPGGRG